MKKILQAILDVVNVAAAPLLTLGAMMYFSGFLRHEGSRIIKIVIVLVLLGQTFLTMI